LILALAAQILDSQGMRFRGILSHFGHTYHAGSTGEIKAIYREDSAKLISLREWLDAEGVAAEVSVGDTPSCSLVEDFGGVDEIRPGNFVFYDAMQKHLGSCSHAQIAGIMVCSVIACHPARHEVVIHGGAVHFSKDYLLCEGQMVFGEMVHLGEQGWSEPLEGCFIEKLSQEHGIVRITDDVMKQVHVGDLLGFIPVHSCLTADAMGVYKLTTGEWADHLDKYDNNPLVNS